VAASADESDTWSDASRDRKRAVAAAAAAKPPTQVGKLEVLWQTPYGIIEKTLLTAGTKNNPNGTGNSAESFSR
jgi:hypothetical protein